MAQRDRDELDRDQPMSDEDIQGMGEDDLEEGEEGEDLEDEDEFDEDERTGEVGSEGGSPGENVRERQPKKPA
jgi:hypothetical protein